MGPAVNVMGAPVLLTVTLPVPIVRFNDIEVDERLKLWPNAGVAARANATAKKKAEFLRNL
jgi:hypothetical protein